MEIKSLVSNTTIHEWCKNLDDTSRTYISKIKHNIQQHLIEKYSMKKTNHIIAGINEMDELYYSKPENNIGSDNVFITPHLDGFLGWIPFMRCWRCIYCITNPNNTTNYFPLNKIQESIITLKPNNFICHDFNRDLHWIKPGIVEKYHESRIVLKLHFYDYPAFLNSIHVFYKNLIELRKQFLSLSSLNTDNLFFDVINERVIGYFPDSDLAVFFNGHFDEAKEVVLPSGNWKILLDENDFNMAGLKTVDRKIVLPNLSGVILERIK